MRVRNDGREAVSLPFKKWSHKEGGSINLALIIEPGELSDLDLEALVLDPNDPRIQQMLKDKNLRVVQIPDRFERILNGL